MLESFAAGIPVIAPDAGGVVHLIRNGENGILFKPQDIADFCAAIQSLVLDATLRKTLGQQGRLDARQHDWDAAKHNLLSVWQK